MTETPVQEYRIRLVRATFAVTDASGARTQTNVVDSEIVVSADKLLGWLERAGVRRNEMSLEAGRGGFAKGTWTEWAPIEEPAPAARVEYRPGMRLRNPETDVVFEVVEWTHAVIMRAVGTGTTAAVPAAMADRYEVVR
jgi:hypothetical protein